MLNIIISILLSCNVPAKGLDTIITDSCDIIELNYYYRDDRLIFSQFIFRTWSNQLKCYYIIDYRLNRSSISPPTLLNGKYVLRWSDDGVYREVYAKKFIVSHFKYDPELKEKHYWDYLDRKGLTK